VVDGMSATSGQNVWAVGHVPIFGLGPVALHWNGTQWAEVPIGGDAVTAVAARTTTDAWAVGFSITDETSSSGDVPVVQHWNGATWTAVPTALAAGDLFAVTAPAANDVWAVGGHAVGTPGPFYTSDSTAEHWDGTAWTALPAITGVRFTGVSRDLTGGVWVTGYNEDPATGDTTAVLYHWTGSHWVQVTLPAAASAPGSKLEGVTTASNGQAWAVGIYPVGSSGSHTALLLHWDGTTWTQSAAPEIPNGSNDELSGVSASSAGDVWAAGSYAPTGANGTHVLVEHWDGAQWSFVAAPQPNDEPNATPQSVFTSITAPSDGSVWAGGWVPAAGSYTAPLVDVLHETTVSNASIAPTASNAPVGATVAWRFTGNAHEVRDTTGTSLFDSGLRSNGGSFTFLPPSAGKYKVNDPTTGHASTLSVSMTDAPWPGGNGFYLQWGATTLDPSVCNCTYEVQIKRPGAFFTQFQTGVAFPDMFWTPGQKGKFQFQARFKVGLHYTGWSPPLTINVS
jgi:hypothetical protein